ncbi:DNA methyltransferase [Azotobacter chroococcum]|uniref:site-specific DNA-methyltransferase (cytosine-N(4)-specific) n=1 Tax=Azotobacter chroococcum NCIMB 8003 TaxID=1328314 RepID=A0A0C4WT20_9GAMM|nr:DNA methyltransferase [Azotobacter chroococcum]AJE22735.1 DNA methylase N-4/N-6 domain-containing protein [Azotobacter chroococcum NCIMB 8003]
MLEKLHITHPKQKQAAKTGFEAFYPYYAGYPQGFADALLSSANLSPECVVLDPWNGSGTTTKAAMQLGLSSIGYDINPAMVVISTARLLPRSEASCLLPLAREIIGNSRRFPVNPERDPLGNWLSESSTCCLRSLERATATMLIPTQQDRLPDDLGISRIVASLYLAFFATARALTKPFRSTNPTWIRKAKAEDEKLEIPSTVIVAEFLNQVERLVHAYLEDSTSKDLSPSVNLLIADSTIKESSTPVDFVLTSPPYCTRIDYAVATSIELAILSQISNTDTVSLSKKMLGTPKVKNVICENRQLPSRCEQFLSAVKKHSSKDSSTYYYKTHLDYYQKMDLSLLNISKSLKNSGTAVLVVQDSYYKEIHNDVPSIISEIANQHGLLLIRREDFAVKKSMVSMNSRAKSSTNNKAVESILCFVKS